MSYIIVGAGGHGRVILDILKAKNENVLGFLDDNPKVKSVHDIPILGKVGDTANIIKNHPDIYFIVGVGDNLVRKNIVSFLNKLGVRFGKAIHPSAVIGSNVSIGAGAVIMPNCIINCSAQVGNHVIVNTNSVIEHDCILADYVHISPGVNLAGNVQVKKGVHVGIGSSVIPGIQIGEWSVIGAGGIVIQPIPKKVLAVGCPAKPIKWLN